MRNLPWKLILAWLLAAFFVFGGIGNIFASESILTDYQRWGYPSWFHYITGVLELAAAALIAMRSTKLAGAALASLVMLAAAGTVLAHGELTHAIVPLLVLCVALTMGFLEWRAGHGRSQSQAGS